MNRYVYAYDGPFAGDGEYDNAIIMPAGNDFAQTNLGGCRSTAYDGNGKRSHVLFPFPSPKTVVETPDDGIVAIVLRHECVK